MEMVIFVDQHRKQYGVEPICKQIRIAPLSYYEHKARERNSDRLPEHERPHESLGRFPPIQFAMAKSQ